MEPKPAFKIFIVDDDPICKELYYRYLVNMGLEDIHLFDNGQDCINALTQNPDIILLDHQMAPIDGLETLRKIKRFNPDIYLVFISGQADMQVAVNALKYGAFDYVTKGRDNEAAIVAIIEKIHTVRELLSRKAPGNKWSRLLSFLPF